MVSIGAPDYSRIWVNRQAYKQRDPSTALTGCVNTDILTFTVPTTFLGRDVQTLLVTQWELIFSSGFGGQMDCRITVDDTQVYPTSGLQAALPAVTFNEIVQGVIIALPGQEVAVEAHSTVSGVGNSQGIGALWGIFLG